MKKALIHKKESFLYFENIKQPIFLSILKLF